ncbi:hypothetical protein LIER_02352 [Lithospermum erythrorhizon]|uniref:HMA domain-containing protein n=1 Tax=Lithospermum erythrorhizon TaxID=34254 RepID=A0AAV3NTR1_LITER
MGKLSVSRVLECFNLAGGGTSSCLCFNGNNNCGIKDDLERNPLIASDEKVGQLVKLKDVISGPPTLAFQLKPKMVVLRVSMHCNGCARKVQKHISKMEGVTSYEVDLETKMAVVIGDIIPLEVLESVSKVVKYAEFWTTDSS